MGRRAQEGRGKRKAEPADAGPCFSLMGSKLEGKDAGSDISDKGSIVLHKDNGGGGIL